VCLTALFVITTTESFSQSKDSINYFIPDIISKQISNYLKEEKTDAKYYAILQEQNDTTSILISSYNGSFEKLVYLIKNTNRYIKVSSSQTLPLLLHSDLLFSEKLHSVRNKGKGNEIISHTDINAGGYSIIYKGLYQDITIIQSKYFQF
jgi:hypothetical protein